MPSYHLLVWLQLCLTYSLATWIDDQLPQVEGLTCENIDASVQDDLPNFDLLHRFQLDMDKEFPSMESIQGTDSAQFAYRINKDSQFALATSDIFPSGLPEQFSFSCTFRKSADNNRTWTLLRINDYNGEAQFGLTLQPQKQVMQFYTLQGDQNGDLVNSQLQTYNFDGVILDDGSWNKIHLSVYPTNVTLYVNCQKISHFSIKPRQIIDVTGDTWLAKYDDDFSTVPLDIQWMLMNCDASRPQRDKCDEISRSHVRQTYQTNSLMKSEHKYVTVVEEKCCQQSLSSDDIKELVLSVLKENLPTLISQFKGQPGKAGKPGKSVVGPPGAPGEKGEPGSTGERGFIGLPGTQGQAGLPGAKGIKGEIGEKGCKGDTGDKGIKGNVGRAGLRGPPGIGQAGSKGERGPSGNPGIAGVRGPQGPIGPPGVCEMCKTFNMDTLQLILSQNQRQTKGPSNTKSA